MQRIGVFVCWCGSNIAGTVDVHAVAEALAKEPGVVLSTNYQYMCSQAGQDMIKDAIKEHNLTGIVECTKQRVERLPLRQESTLIWLKSQTSANNVRGFTKI